MRGATDAWAAPQRPQAGRALQRPLRARAGSKRLRAAPGVKYSGTTASNAVETPPKTDGYGQPQTLGCLHGKQIVSAHQLAGQVFEHARLQTRQCRPQRNDDSFFSRQLADVGNQLSQRVLARPAQRISLAVCRVVGERSDERVGDIVDKHRRKPGIRAGERNDGQPPLQLGEQIEERVLASENDRRLKNGPTQAPMRLRSLPLHPCCADKGSVRSDPRGARSCAAAA